MQQVWKFAILTQSNSMRYLFIFFLSIITLNTIAQQSVVGNLDIQITQHLWDQFSKDERVAILSKFPTMEIISSESIGIIQSAQLVDRSTQGTNSGAVLGSVIGQAAYIDRSFTGSNNSYSATTHLGVGILGAMLGSTLDNKAQRRFIINYGVKTLDGQVREQRVSSPDEFTKPVGQCVRFPEIITSEISLCTDDKNSFLGRISAIAKAPNDAIVSRENSGLNVKCNLPGIGMMSLEKNACLQMDGKIE